MYRVFQKLYHRKCSFYRLQNWDDLELTPSKLLQPTIEGHSQFHMGLCNYPLYGNLPKSSLNPVKWTFFALNFFWGTVYIYTIYILSEFQLNSHNFLSAGKDATSLQLAQLKFGITYKLHHFGWNMNLNILLTYWFVSMVTIFTTV